MELANIQLQTPEVRLLKIVIQLLLDIRETRYTEKA